MNRASRAAALLALFASPAFATDPQFGTVRIQRVEHGWKTSRAVAIRHTNPDFGYNIGFILPENLYDGDNPVFFEYMEKNGGSVISGGGYPGAEMLVLFDGVTDKASADSKILKILPGLHRLSIKVSRETACAVHKYFGEPC